MRVVSLDHVQLAMPIGGEDEARAFYAGLLGMREVPRPPVLAARGGCWFQSGTALVHLGVDAAFVPARRAHPALVVGRRRLYVADPFGNRLELLQDGDGFSPR